MLLENTRDRQKQLLSYIRELAKECLEEPQIREYAFKLKDLYTGDFRHSYSDFFPLLTDIDKSNKNGGFEYLLSNLESLKRIVEQDSFKPEDKKEFDELLLKNIFKLSDHINLEVSRCNYNSSKEQQLINIDQRTVESQRQLEDATSKLTDAQEKIQSIQTEFIAVLSIFAAIVLTFSGGINLMSAALAGMEKTTISKSIFIILSCGFIVINSIFMMIYLIGKLTGRNIYARCKTENCNCNPSCNGVLRICKRLPYVFWINILILLILMIDAIYIIMSRHIIANLTYIFLYFIF